MGFYRIIKNVVRFILYQLPKKWLIMIIFALLMVFGLTKVQGYEYVSQNDIDFLDYIDLNGHSFNTGVHINSNSDTNCSFQLAFSTENVGQYNYIYLQGSSFGIYPSDITQKDICGVFVNNSANTQFYYNNVQYWSGTTNMSANTKYYIRQDKNVLYKPNTSGLNFVVANTFSSNFNNLNGYTFIIAPRAKAVTFKVFDFIVYNSSNGVLGESYHFYPAKYGSKYGFYESVHSNFYEVSGVTGGGVNPNPPFVIPYITTTQSDIENWSFDTLNIDGGSMQLGTQYGLSAFWLYVDYNGQRNYVKINDYIATIMANNVTFKIPKNVLIDNSAIVSGRDIDFILYYTYPIGDSSIASNWNSASYDLGSYVLSLTQTEQDNINNDQTIGALNDINNNINNMNNNINNVVTQQEETNNFLQNTTVNNTDKTLPSMNIQDSQVVTQVDGSYSNFFNEYISLFGSELPTSISLYIPNMSTGGIASTITIPSNYVKSHLTGVSIPLINVSLLELVEMIWYVVFAFWFLGFATNLVTIIYSGEIMDNKGLRSLTKAYTGVSKNML